MIWLCVVSVVCASVARVGAVVGGAPASPPEPDAAVVFVQRHGMSARLEGIKNDRLGYYSFYGIRYAEPPLGPRRFQRPVRRLLQGELSANKPCLPCPQPDPYTNGGVIGNEDCLCLNIFSPKMPGDESGCPVIFFIHGGNYRSGSATPYGGQHFTQKDTIIVTAQYRLGSLGYLSTGQRDAAGNLGLFDMLAVKQWIDEYIQFFGGDPKRVVVMGQGSGGSAASLLAMSPEGRSASGVAALSGTALSPGAVRSDPAQHAQALAQRTGCPPEPAERLVMCLRTMPAEKIVLADMGMEMDGMDTEQFLNDLSGRSGAGARVEGQEDLRGLPPVVAESPADALNRKEKRPPLLTGVTSHETANAVNGKYSKFLQSQLKNVKDFIKKDLIGGLQSVVSGVEGLLPLGALQQVLPLADYYQTVFQTSLNAIDGLSEIAEATGDALFNFPAFQTVNSWSAGGSAFLYSFEYVGNLTKGSYFLPNLALTDQSADPALKGKTKGPSHGDELAYLFEPLDSDGNSVSGEMSAVDARARDSFVELVAKFARASGDRGNVTLDTMPPYQKDNDQFLKIGDTVTVEKGFRFCQMGIWGNMADRLTGVVCKNLITDLLGQVTGKLPLGGVDKVLQGNQLPLGGVDKVLQGNQLPLGGAVPVNQQPANKVPLVGGLLGARTTARPKQRQPTRRTTMMNLGLPFDF